MVLRFNVSFICTNQSINQILRNSYTALGLMKVWNIFTFNLLLMIFIFLLHAYWILLIKY